MNTISNPKILVVDDDSLLRMHASDLLDEAGYTVVEAMDAASAVKVLEEQPDVRLLFTDVQMPPGSDGIALAELVHKRWPNVLLLITSGGRTVESAEIPDHGRFVEKPYADQKVLGQIASMISEKPDLVG